MKVCQFTYTASPWSSTGSGWMMFQKSEGIVGNEAERLASFFKYETRDIDPSNAPVQYVFCPRNDGKGFVISQSTFTGMRWYGEPRPGDYFAHVLIFDEVDFVSLNFNPMLFFLCGKVFQQSFPDALRKEALAIYNHETSYYPPPPLATYQSLAEVGTNDKFLFDNTFARLADKKNAISKIGRIVSALYKGMSIVFDSSSDVSVDVMAFVLDLMPLSWRSHFGFATHVDERVNLQPIKGYVPIRIYATMRKGETADPDTGVYGYEKLPDGGPLFNMNGDVEMFKSLLIACGARLDVNEYDGLIQCWQVMTGRDCTVKGMRCANEFCSGDDRDHPRFPRLREVLQNNLVQRLAEVPKIENVEWRNRFAIAKYEWDVDTGENVTELYLDKCMSERAVCEEVLECMENDVAARYAFLKDIEKHANGNCARSASLINVIGELKIDLSELVKTLPEDCFLRLAWEYRQIREDIQQNRDSGCLAWDVEAALRIVNQLFSATGPDGKDISKSKKYLEYLKDLAEIKQVDDIVQKLAQYATPEFLDEVDVKKDVVAILVTLSVHEIESVYTLGKEMDALGLPGKAVVLDLWEGERVTFSRREMTYKKIGIFIAVIACALGVAIGFLAAKKYGGKILDRQSYGDRYTQRVVVELPQT